MSKYTLNKNLISLAAVIALSGNLLAISGWSVTTFVDENDNNCTDTASLSLRDAIYCSNGLPVLFSVNGTFGLSGSDQIVIDKNITIVGNGIGNTILDMNNSRYFDINSSAVVSMSNITFSGTDTFAIKNSGNLHLSDSKIETINTSGGRYGAGRIYNDGNMTIERTSISGNTSYSEDGGAISNIGDLNISDSDISNNTVSCGSNHGGAIYNAGSLSITRTVLSNNNTDSSSGGAIYNNSGATMSIIDSNLTNNSANGINSIAGGAIYNNNSFLSIEKSIFSNNTANDNGGVIYSSGSQINIQNSTFYDNNSSNNGGAIYSTGSSMSVYNTTISGNGAVNNGGGIYNSSSDMNISNSTIAYNASGMSTPATTGGGIYNLDGSVNIKNTIIANNVDYQNHGPNIFGNITSYGYNLITTDQDANITYQDTNITYPASGDINETDPLLNTLVLGDYTYSHTLQPVSPAIDSGSCTDIYGTTITTDQNGTSRPQGYTCDIGSVEFIPDANSSIDLTINLTNVSLLEHNVTNIQIIGVDGNSENLNIPYIADGNISDGNNSYTVPIYYPDNNFSIRVDTNTSGTYNSWWYNFDYQMLFIADDGSSGFKTEINSTNNTFNIDLNSTILNMSIQAEILTIYNSEAYLAQTLPLELFSVNADGSVSKYYHDSNGTKLIYQASDYAQMIDGNTTLTLNTTFDYNSTNNRFSSNSINYGFYSEINSTTLDSIYTSVGFSGISFPSDALIKFIYFEDSNISDVRFNQSAMIYMSTFFDANTTYIDTDGDGYPDNIDAFPNDVAASIDTDGDGYPDSWNSGKTQSDSTTGLTLDADPNDPNVTTAASSAPTITHIYDRVRRPGFGSMIISFDVNDSDSTSLNLDINTSGNNIISVSSSPSEGNISANTTVTLTVNEVDSSQSGHDAIFINLSDEYSNTYKDVHVQIESRFDIISNKESSSSAYDSASSNSYTGTLYVLNTYQDYNQSVVEYEKIEITDSNFSDFIEVKDIGGVVYGIKTEANDLPDTMAFESTPVSLSNLNTLYSDAGMPFPFTGSSEGQRIYVKYPAGKLEIHDDINDSYMSPYTTLEDFMVDQVKDVTPFGVMRNNDGSRLLVFDTSSVDLNDTATLSGNLIELDENGTEIDANAGDWNKTTINSTPIVSIHPTLSGYPKDMAYVLEDSMVKHAEYKSAGDIYSYILLNKDAKDEIYNSLSPNPKLSFTLNNGYTYVALPHSKSLCDSNDTIQTDLASICDQNNTLESIFGTNSNIDTLFKYTDEWVYWDSAEDINASYFMNKFSTISPLDGLLVHTTAATTVNIPFDFEDNQTNTYENMPIEQWMMLSNNKEQSAVEIKTAVEDQNQTLMYIQLYRDNTWYVYAPTNDSLVSTSIPRLSTVKPYESFWIYLK